MIFKNIKAIVESETEDWGIKIIDVKIKDIQLPENMRRMMANQAEAERSRRARVILALAEEQAAGKLLEAGKLIDQSPSAIKLRLYQTLANIAAEKNSTIIFLHGVSNEHFNRQKHQGHHPGHDRQYRYIPHRTGAGLWHADGCGRDAGQGRHDPYWSAQL